MPRSRSVLPIIGVTAAIAASVLVAPAATAAPPDYVRIDDNTTIQAEDFQRGGYSDTTPENLGGVYRSTGVDVASGGSRYFVGWTEPGEWLQYGLDVDRAGQYSIKFRLSASQTARTFRVTVDGRNVSGTVSYSGQGWDTFGTVVADLGTLSAGRHTMRIVLGTGDIRIDRFAVRRESIAARPGADYPGQPSSGDVLWGAFYRSASGSTDVAARFESPAGQRLEVRRSYFSWSQRTTSMITASRADLAAGRLPWVSIKPPSWAAMASGQYDGQIDQMLRALNGLNGPVWLTVHHEPEGGGGRNSSDDPAGPAGHLAMNERIRDRMTALGVDNVALAPILMEWTFNPQSGRNPNAYWAPGVYDFLGIDTYSKDGETFLDANWQTIRNWADSRNTDVAVGEFGILGNGQSAANVMSQFYRSAVASAQDGNGARVVALTVFDSAPKDWDLSSTELAEFREILSDQ